jgi:hypothetical protein
VVFIHVMAGGLTPRVQDKRGALAISPTIVILIGKHGVIHSSLILIPDIVVPVGVVSEEPIAPPVVLLPVSSSFVADAGSSSAEEEEEPANGRRRGSTRRTGRRQPPRQEGRRGATRVWVLTVMRSFPSPRPPRRTRTKMTIQR